ncbi:MAG: beta/gamma crystallin family protein [Pyrinomonadaceae bacterium]|nr:beta/gamma crystallin family protein [Pyrinomonadaceae bacterium]
MAEIVLFEHINFRGAHKHLYGSEGNLAAPDDNFFNDKISSFVVVSGSWQFFRDINFAGPASNVFGPGRYSWVESVGIPNDSVSSVRRVA